MSADFGSNSFTFEDYAEQCVKPYLKPNEVLEEVAEASLILLIKQGYIEKIIAGERTWYIRTKKALPPKRK